jgi:hypothetical protein
MPSPENNDASLTNKPNRQLSLTTGEARRSVFTARQTDAPPLVSDGVRDGSNINYQRLLAEWQAPIDFFGKVEDENTNAVPEATVNFAWLETPLDNGQGTAAATTDSDGRFSLRGKRGESLQVWVTKSGYYTPSPGFQSFNYSLIGHFSADPRNPVVFRLRKKSQGAELISSENGLRPNLAVRISKENVPVRISFSQKRPTADGEMEISQFKPAWKDATNWSFTMSIPGGGLVEQHDEFPFAAPERGYQSTVRLRFEKSETNWITHFSGNYYITFGEPRKYGWLHIESDIAQETVFLTYAINPSGSRNLEPAN